VFKSQLPSDPVIGNYIINMGGVKQGGTHWVALCIDQHKNIFYFDSFGCLPPEDVLDFIRLFKRGYGYNIREIQDINSELCGYFCLGLLKTIHSGKVGSLYDKAEEFTDLFDNNTAKNDGILRNFFKEYKSDKIIGRLFR
jgi:hypothetical protein